MQTPTRLARHTKNTPFIMLENVRAEDSLVRLSDSQVSSLDTLSPETEDSQREESITGQELHGGSR
jgi:hypothetical protein